MVKKNKIKSKRERFEIVASKRVQKIIDSLDILGNCSNKNNYEYNENDIQKMFKVIKEKLKEIELIYESKINKNKNITFKF